MSFRRRASQRSHQLLTSSSKLIAFQTTSCLLNLDKPLAAMLIKESHVDVPTTANGKDSSMRTSSMLAPHPGT